MSKTLYYRVTDRITGKQQWIKLDGITGTNNMIFIDKDKFEKAGGVLSKPLGESPFIVYKSTSKVRGKK